VNLKRAGVCVSLSGSEALLTARATVMMSDTSAGVFVCDESDVTRQTFRSSTPSRPGGVVTIPTLQQSKRNFTLLRTKFS